MIFILSLTCRPIPAVQWKNNGRFDGNFFHGGRQMAAKMEPIKRHKTKYDGVYYRIGKNRQTGEPEKVFYIAYYREGKQIEEMAGRGRRDQMTALKASRIRGRKIEGIQPTRKEQLKAEEAAKAAAKAEAERWTIDRLWTAWKADPENQGKRGTAKADNKYRKHLREPFGDREPKNIIQTDIDRLRLTLAKTYAKETTRSVISLLHRIIRYGSVKGYSDALPFPIVLKGKRLGKDPEIKRAPTDAEIAAYVKTCRDWEDPQAGAFQLFMVYTGVRRGSTRNLKWSDISFEDETAVLRDSKTGTLSIELSKDAVELLRNHPRSESAFVFTGSGPGGCRSDREIDRVPAMIRDAAGLPKDLDPCHMLRRNLATRLDKRGASVTTIMRAGGWKSPAMVHHYTATEKETVRKAVDGLADSIRAAEGGNLG